MAPTAPNSSTINLKLLVDPKHQKVLFAEAGKDFVDFLFTLLSLPVGTVTRLLSKDGMVGSFGKLYEGVENISDTYMQPYLDKDILLNPKTPVAGPNVLGLLESPATNKLFYMCSKNYSILSPHGPASHRYVTEDPKELCPSCKSTMSSEATYASQPKATAEPISGARAAGYVKGNVTYMITDDLEVKPAMSTISSITLLNSFSVKDISALEVKVVELGMDEGVKLLKESLNSNSVLTNVFLGKKAAAVSVSQAVHFRSFDKPKEDDFSLVLSKLHTYDDVVERVAQQLGLDDPSKIRLTSHNCFSQQPEPQSIEYRGVERLTDMLVHYNQTSDILYYEVLDIPLPELQGLKTLKVAFHHATKDEVVIHTIGLPKQSTVGDLINDLKNKVELSHPEAELRLLEVFYHKIYKVFPQSEKIENMNDQYWTVRAEEVPEDEQNLGPNDRVIHVYHFTKGTAQNQMQIQNFGEPFFLVIHEGETLAEIRVRIQKKLQVADEEFAKWKFAFISLGPSEYLQDSDVVSSRFQRRDLYGSWGQYLGLEHDSTPNRVYAANQNRRTFKKPVKIYN